MAYEAVDIDTEHQFSFFDEAFPLFREASPLTTSPSVIGAISVRKAAELPTPLSVQAAAQLELIHQEGNYFMKPPRSLSR